MGRRSTPVREPGVEVYVRIDCCGINGTRTSKEKVRETRQGSEVVKITNGREVEKEA